MRPVYSDTGSATVWWVSLSLLLWFLTLAVAMTAAARLDRDRAATAADLAAPAAADRAAHGTHTACGPARRTAAASDASPPTRAPQAGPCHRRGQRRLPHHRRPHRTHRRRGGHGPLDRPRPPGARTGPRRPGSQSRPTRGGGMIPVPVLTSAALLCGILQSTPGPTIPAPIETPAPTNGFSAYEQPEQPATT